MATVTIGSTDFTTYATVAQADAYLLASINFTTWDALTDDVKGRYIVSASRFLDSLSWKADCLPLADTDGGYVNEATILIAEQLILGNTAVIGLSVTEDATKRLKADSTEIEYMARPWFAQVGAKYKDIPDQIFNLIRDCLSGSAGTSASIGATSYGTDGTAGDSLHDGDFGLTSG